MLCQFTVKNFKSIRDEMTFDMQAAAISEHEDRIIKDRDGEVFSSGISRVWAERRWKIQCAGGVAQSGAQGVETIICDQRYRKTQRSGSREY